MRRILVIAATVVAILTLFAGQALAIQEPWLDHAMMLVHR